MLIFFLNLLLEYSIPSLSYWVAIPPPRSNLTTCIQAVLIWLCNKIDLEFLTHGLRCFPWLGQRSSESMSMKVNPMEQDDNSSCSSFPPLESYYWSWTCRGTWKSTGSWSGTQWWPEHVPYGKNMAMYIARLVQIRNYFTTTYFFTSNHKIK